MRTLIPQLHQLLLLHPAMLLLHHARIPLLVHPSVPEPQEAVDDGADRNHAERDGVAARVSRSVFLGAVLGEVKC